MQFNRRYQNEQYMLEFQRKFPNRNPRFQIIIHVLKIIRSFQETQDFVTIVTARTKIQQVSY